MMKVAQLRQYVDKQRGREYGVQDVLNKKKDEEVELRKGIRRHEQALAIIKQVSLKTQQQLQFHISDIATMALASVFNDPYDFSVEFVERRDKTECDLSFVRDGHKVDPITASGCGAVDIASFALRVAGWSMESPRLRNTIVLDEPMRYLSEDNQEKASAMLKDVSEKLGIQFIVVTHEDILTSFADKVFKVSIKNKVSRVK